MLVRRIRSRSALPIICLASLAFAACGGGGPSGDPSPSRVSVFAGLNDPKDPNIAVLAFLPKSIKIVVGAKVTWRIPGPEPHTVTFVGAGQPTPSPSTPNATQPIGSPGPFDGSATISSGLEPKGTKSFRFALTFPKAGVYNYVCAVHPQMTGTVDVTSGPTESQAAIQDRAETERDRYLAEGRAAKKQLTQTPAKSQQNPDGSTAYTVEMGIGTAHTEVLAFQPVKAALKAGDKVVFLNNTGLPHTASFAGSTSLPASPDSPEAMAPAPGKSPQTLNATDFFNTGWLPPNVPGGGPPGAARSFTFIVPTAGTYAYVCLLHKPSGMEGQIVAT